MKIPFGRPILEIEEKQAIQKVLENPILVHGPNSIKFEDDFKNYTGAETSISVSSCTAGMHLVYFALGLGEGDEVIVPAQTHVATAHAVELVGAKAIFVDICKENGNIDPELIESAISSRTRAIAIVHYLGVPVDMEKVMKIAKRHNLFVLEDCALALGARINGIHTGLIGDAGVFSFYPIKHITTAEGGMIILKDKKLENKLKRAKAFGIDKTHSERKNQGIYEAIDLGFNYRMSEIHAALGIEQLKKLPEFLKKRRENFNILEKGLDDLKNIRILPQPVNVKVTSSHYCCGMLLGSKLTSKRSEIINRMKEVGIGTSIYYPNPVPRMNYYRKKYGYNASSFINSSYISDNIISLPVGPHLNKDSMDYIVKSIKMILSNLND